MTDRLYNKKQIQKMRNKSQQANHPGHKNTKKSKKKDDEKVASPKNRSGLGNDSHLIGHEYIAGNRFASSKEKGDKMSTL